MARRAVLNPSLFRPFSSCGSASATVEPRLSTQTKVDLFVLPRSTLANELKRIGVDPVLANNVFRSVYVRGATDLFSVPDMPQLDREVINNHFSLGTVNVSSVTAATDGTKKLLVSLPKARGGADIETVFIPGVTAFSRSPNESAPSSVPSTAAANRPSGSSGTAFAAAPPRGAPVHGPFPAPPRPAAPRARGSLCVSSQTACSLRCAFCRTGSLPKEGLRNLTAGEIVSQVMLAKRMLSDFPPEHPSERLHSPAPPPQLSSIVFMGMGEPGYNYRSVRDAISIVTDPSGLALPRSSVTVSSAGVVPSIARLGRDMPGVGLAISLHAVSDELRDVLVPLNKTWNIAAVVAAAEAFPGARRSRPVVWEYVLLQGVNDSDADAAALARLVSGVPSLINIIPFNPWPGSDFTPSPRSRVDGFRQAVLAEAEAEEARGRGRARCVVRATRGDEVMAACGQLAAGRAPDAAAPSRVADVTTPHTV